MSYIFAIYICIVFSYIHLSVQVPLPRCMPTAGNPQLHSTLLTLQVHWNCDCPAWQPGLAQTSLWIKPKGFSKPFHSPPSLLFCCCLPLTSSHKKGKPHTQGSTLRWVLSKGGALNLMISPEKACKIATRGACLAPIVSISHTSMHCTSQCGVLGMNAQEDTMGQEGPPFSEILY